MAEEVGFEPTFAFTKTVFLTTPTFMSHFHKKCCGLDYIFAISGVSRIVSEDPTNIIYPRFPADHPYISQDCYLRSTWNFRASQHTARFTLLVHFHSRGSNFQDRRLQPLGHSSDNFYCQNNISSEICKKNFKDFSLLLIRVPVKYTPKYYPQRCKYVTLATGFRSTGSFKSLSLVEISFNVSTTSENPSVNPFASSSSTSPSQMVSNVRQTP
jgi:hypothetical protein